MLVDSMNQMLKNIILSIVNIAKALHYGVKRVVLMIKPFDSISTMHSANTIQDNNDEIENEIKRFLHGDDDEQDDEHIYIPYDGPYSETP